MIRLRRLAAAAALVLSAGHAQPAPLKFLAIGDVPYFDAELDTLRLLLAQETRANPAFLLHVGDIKGGAEPCTHARNRVVADLFRIQPVPVLYTPGDNEWTDCHRRAAGGRDPLERLAALRRQFYADEEVLRTGVLNAVVPDAAFPENLYLVRERVVIVLLHVVGSNDNAGSTQPGAAAERAARGAANRFLLARAARVAADTAAPALVVAFHANPLFEERGARDGFVPLKAALRAALAIYSGPVLAVHGDTHRYRFDTPLAAAGNDRPIERFRRLEVPGSPFVGAAWVTIDAEADPVIRVHAVYPHAGGDSN